MSPLTVPLLAHTIASDNAAGSRSSPAHNDIVGKLVLHVLPDRASR